MCTHCCQRVSREHDTHFSEALRWAKWEHLLSDKHLIKKCRAVANEHETAWQGNSADSLGTHEAAQSQDKNKQHQ